MFYNTVLWGFWGMNRVFAVASILAASAIPFGVHAGALPEQTLKDLDAGYCRRALAVIQPLLADHAKDAELQYDYGRALLGLNKPDDAAAAFKTAIGLDPKNGLYHGALGDAYGLKAQQGFASGSEGMFGMMGLMKSAKAEWLTALELSPADTDAHVSLAMYYIMVPGIMGGSYSKAHDLEAELDKLDPVQALQVRANEAGNKDDSEQGISLLKQAVAQDKTQGSRLALGLFYQNAKRYDDALATFREMAKDPKGQMAWYQIGKTADVAKSGYDEGIAALKQYLGFTDLPDTLPTPAWAHYRLGDIYGAQGQKDQARSEFQMALAMNVNGDPDLASRLSKAQAALN